jgi:hypothetical protein
MEEEAVMEGNIEEFGTGWKKWNLQAWMDFIMMKIMMGRVGDVIPKTYVPILRLVAEDAGKVDDEYRRVVSVREPIRLFDSPRDRWRKMYGSYVRELEWVFGELQKHFLKEEYEELAIDILARTIRDWLGAFLPSLEKSARADAEASHDPHAPGQEPSAIARWAARALERAMNGWPGRWVMNHMNPVNAIVGPVEMKPMAGGTLEMEIPRCWMHTAPGDGKTQDQACVVGCKGACERVFGPHTPAHMVFDPHLPEFSCTLTVYMGGAGPKEAEAKA